MIKINHIELRVQNMRTRMPFRFGISTMTDVPHLILCLELEENGQAALGYSADHLPPKWFTKNPETSLEEEVGDMIFVIRNACAAALSISPSRDLFSHWFAIYKEQKTWGGTRNIPALLWGFGVSLVERAMIEAFCRLRTTNFGDAIRSNIFSLRFEKFHSELKNVTPADILPPSSQIKTNIRHTVGLSDPLVRVDIPKDEYCNDGLPQSLDDVIDYYGINYFKIKLCGDKDHDLNRLRQAADVIDTRLNHYAFTLDGNENYKSLETFRSFWEDLVAVRAFDRFRRSLICIEQPLHRNMALDEEVKDYFTNWKTRPPFIIDESDGDIGDVQRAIDIGYSGTSYKNCKGVFKGLFNFAFLKQMKAKFPERLYMVTSEDLSNVPPIALLQDLAVLSTLGLEHTERNGHHYFKGLTAWPQKIQQKTLENHPDLFSEHSGGFPHLKIQNGEIMMESVTKSPFGTAFSMDISEFTKLDDWNYDSMTAPPSDTKNINS